MRAALERSSTDDLARDQIRAKAPPRRGCSERPPEVYYIKGHSRAAAIPINEAMEIVG